MDRLFIHVGYPKTGTTSLQSNLFSEHSQIFDFRSQVPEVSEMREGICRDPSFQPASVRPQVKRALQQAPTDVGVYSEEIFTSNLENTAPDGVERSTVARRLYEVFSLDGISTEVICVIRRQQSFLLSAFTFWYYNYRSMGYDDLDELIYAGTEGTDCAAVNILAWLRYFDTIDAYRNYFGAENLHVFLYENLNQNAESFVRRLSRVMGVGADESARLLNASTDRNVTKSKEERRAPSKVYHWLSSLKSTYLPNTGSIRSSAIGRGFVSWLRGKGGAKISLSDPSRARLRTLYAQDNRKLQEEFDLGLGEHGYFVP